MSGLEVVGVVLGAIPIVVAAIDEFKTAKKILRTSRTIAAELNNLKEELNEEKVLIEVYWKHLLRAVGVDHEITQDTCGQEELQNANVAEALEAHLGDLYTPFKSALNRCEQIIWEIARKIKGFKTLGKQQLPQSLDEFVKTLTPSRAEKYAFTAKIKLGLNYDELRQRISDLSQARMKLDAITKASQLNNTSDNNSEPVKNSSKTAAKFATFVSNVRNHAAALYWAIASAWVQSCHIQHRAKFFLQSHRELLAANGRGKSPPVAFRIVFESIASAESSSDMRKGVDVELLDDGFADVNKNSKSRINGVKFVQQDEDGRSIPTPSRVHMICDLLRQAGQQPDQLLKVYLCERQLSNCFHAHTLKAPTASPDMGEHTEQIVRMSDLYVSKSVSWKLKQRMALAFDLSSSLLQLHTTPWLPEYWTKDRICFIRDEHNQNVVLFARPFILGNFPNAAPSQNLEASLPPSHSKLRLDARRALLEFGITLMEIYHRITLETYAATAGKQSDGSYNTRWELAREWLGEAEDEMAPLYIDAVRNCVECCLPTDSGSPDWSDKTFQISVCESIVRPLWENCKTFG